METGFSNIMSTMYHTHITHYMGNITVLHWQNYALLVRNVLALC